jgi:hypothetical protein
MNEDDAEAILGRDFPFVAAAPGRAGPPNEQKSLCTVAISRRRLARKAVEARLVHQGKFL